MPETRRPSRVDPSRRRPPSAIAHIQSLAGRSPTPVRYFREALAVIGRELGAPLLKLQLEFHGRRIDETFAPDLEVAQRWEKTAEALTLQGNLEPEPVAHPIHAADEAAHLGIVVPLGEHLALGSGMLVAIVPVPENGDPETVRQLTVGLAAHMARQAPEPQAEKKGPPVVDAADKALSKSAKYESVTEFAFALTNNLRARTGCEQVGFALRTGPTLKLVTLSGHDEVKPKGPATTGMRQAMAEAMDRGEPIYAQNDDDWSDAPLSSSHRLHRQWHEATGGSAVASIPILDGPKTVAVLSLQRHASKPFSREEAQKINEMVSGFGPAIRLLHRANRGLASHAAASLFGTLAWLGSPRGIAMKLGLLLIVAAGCFVAFGHLPYTVTASSIITPIEARHFAAPFEGRLVEAPFRIGDRVEAGQVLYRFDVRDLELRLGETETEMRVIDQEIRRAVAEGERAEAQVAQARRRVLEAKERTLRHQMDRAVGRAATDGILISGDLRQRIGEIIPLGEALFSLVPSDGLRLEIAIPESQLRDLAAELEGEFASTVRPDEPLRYVITRLSPAAEVREGKNVFVATARIRDAERAPWLRVGMAGAARTELGEAPVWWLLSRGPLDWLRLNFWL